MKRKSQDRWHYLCDPKKQKWPLYRSCGLSLPFGLVTPPPPCIFSPPIFKPHKILPEGLHWLSTPLQGWPGACKLPLSGWLLYLYWFKLFPLPIHYAGIPPCWGQLCYSFLWLKPKSYLSNSLGTNPLGVNNLSPKGPLLTPSTTC